MVVSHAKDEQGRLYVLVQHEHAQGGVEGVTLTALSAQEHGTLAARQEKQRATDWEKARKAAAEVHGKHAAARKAAVQRLTEKLGVSASELALVLGVDLPTE